MSTAIKTQRIATTGDARRQFLNESRLDEKIKQLLSDLDTPQ